MRRLISLSVLAAVTLIAGCGASNGDEIRQWLVSERNQAKPESHSYSCSQAVCA